MCQVSQSCPPNAGDATAYPLPIHQNAIRNKCRGDKAQTSPHVPRNQLHPCLSTADPRFWAPCPPSPRMHRSPGENIHRSLSGFKVSPGPAWLLPSAPPLGEAGVSLPEQPQPQQGHRSEGASHHPPVLTTGTWGAQSLVEQVTGETEAARSG